MQEESWRNHGGETMEEEALVEPFWGPTWSQVGSKLGPSRVQVGAKTGPRGALGEAQASRIDFDRFVEPTWSQVGTNLAS